MTSLRHARYLLLSLLLVLGMVLAACGDDDDTGADPDANGDEADDEDLDEASIQERMREHYDGQRLTFVISHAPGGSTEAWAAIIAQNLPRHIPGEPRLVMDHRPGAGGILASHYMLTQVEPDGYTMGALGGGVVNEQATEGLLYEGEELDLLDLEWIGGIGDTNVYYGNADVFPDGHQSLSSPTESPFFAGLTGVDATSATGIAILELLGVDTANDIGLLTGYSGSAEKQLSMAQGEIHFSDIRVSGYNTEVRPLVDDGDYVPMWQLGIVEGGEVVRHPGVDDVPTWVEVHEELQGGEPSGELYDYVFWDAGTKSLLRPLAFPPGTPDWIVEGMRQAFADMLGDPQFLNDQENLLGTRTRTHLLGPDAEEAANNIIGSAAEVMDIFQDFISRPPFQ